MTQRKWGIHMHRKIKKHNWIPICPPIRAPTTSLPVSFSSCQFNPSTAAAIRRGQTGCHFECVYLFTECAETWRQLLQIDSLSRNKLSRKSAVFPATPECIPIWKYFHADRDYIRISAWETLDYHADSDQGSFRRHTEILDSLKAIILENRSPSVPRNIQIIHLKRQPVIMEVCDLSTGLCCIFQSSFPPATSKI